MNNQFKSIFYYFYFTETFMMYKSMYFIIEFGFESCLYIYTHTRARAMSPTCPPCESPHSGIPHPENLVEHWLSWWSLLGDTSYFQCTTLIGVHPLSIGIMAFMVVAGLCCH